MDVVHHGVIGAVGLVTLSAKGQTGLGIAFAAGNVLPDLDVLFMALGKRFYLKNHQRFTHSFFVIRFLVLFVSLPFAQSTSTFIEASIVAAIGFSLHILMDLTNTYGITLLWPLSSKRFSLDAIFFIDATAWVLTLLCLVVSFARGPYYSFKLFIFLFGIYAFLKLLIRRSLMRKLGVNVLVPSALNPFVFFAVEEGKDIVTSYSYNHFSGRKRLLGSYQVPDRHILELARKSKVFRDMEEIAKFLHITSVKKTQEGTLIEAQDLGVRNFGGKFGHTQLGFDKDDNLIHEDAKI